MTAKAGLNVLYEVEKELCTVLPLQLLNHLVRPCVQAAWTQLDILYIAALDIDAIEANTLGRQVLDVFVRVRLAW